MATVEGVSEAGKLGTHTRVATVAPARQVYYTLPPFFHHQSTKAGVGFYASRWPEPG